MFSPDLVLNPTGKRFRQHGRQARVAPGRFRSCGALVIVWLLVSLVPMSWWLRREDTRYAPWLSSESLSHRVQHDISDAHKLRDQLVVLGMHHSGTSVITMLLNSTGIHTGWPRRLLMRKDNSFKYWELRDAVSTNQRILDSRHATAHLPSDSKHRERPGPLNWIGNGFDVNKVPKPNLRAFHQSIERITGNLNDKVGRPWAVKDPRMSLVAGAWLTHMTAPVCVLVARDPVEMAVRFLGYNQVCIYLGNICESCIVYRVS
jgi:hypothetical protein